MKNPSEVPEQPPLSPADPAPPGSRLRKNLELCTWEGLTAMPLVFLTLPGNFIIALLLTQVFDLRESVYGLIVSLPAWCNVIQLFLMPFLMRRWSQKGLTLAFGWGHLVCWLALAAALPVIPQDNPLVAAQLFFILFLASSFLQSVVGVSWTSWVQEWIPQRLRGTFFGKRNRLCQIATIVFLLAAGQVLAWFEPTDPIRGFQLLMLVAIGLRAFSLFAQQRILGSSPAAQDERAVKWSDQLKLIRGSPSLVWLIAFGAAFGMAANFLGPFFAVFMYDILELNVARVGALVVTSSITGAFSLPGWGRFLDRYGNRPVMVFTLGLWMVMSYGWIFIHPGNTWVLFFLFAGGGVFSAGFFLGSFSLLLKLVPPQAKTAAISFNLAATSITAAIAPILGGGLLDLLSPLVENRLRILQAVALVHHSLVLSTLVILLKVREPRSASVGQVVGAMRSYRQVGALLGLSFLVNYTFIRRAKQAKDPDSET